MKFVGWRRFGMILWLTWIAAIASLATYEWSTRSTGMFVYRTIPLGTTLDVETNSATLPDGRSVRLKQQLADHEPWQLDWNNEPEVASVFMLAWKRAMRLGLLLPLTLWLAIELVALISTSIAKVFRPKRAA